MTWRSCDLRHTAICLDESVMDDPDSIGQLRRPPLAERSVADCRLDQPKEPSPLRIATWNVNSIRQRLPHLLAYLKEVQPDVLCLQEIKCLAEQFPRMKIG